MKDFFFGKIEHFRYERKFHIQGITKKGLEDILRFHPQVFREIYNERVVNSIYFDSHDLENYFDNINGTDRRLKVRVRWYGDVFTYVKNPTLELKVKHNLHVGKLLYPLEPFRLEKGFSIDTMREVFKDSKLNDLLRFHLLRLEPSILTSYNRKYFLSSSGGYRITIDDKLRSYGLSAYDNNFLHKTINENGMILEVKYDKPYDDQAGDITNYFPFRITRISKYVDGVSRLFA